VVAEIRAALPLLAVDDMARGVPDLEARMGQEFFELAREQRLRLLLIEEDRSTVRDAILSYDQQIETLARQHPDFAIIDSLPRAGPALVPRLIAALGTQRDRYHSASELQSYTGIAPVLASSGKQYWVHWRCACPKFVRQTFHEWATHSIGSSAWAKAYYEQQRAKGKPRNTVVRALAFKWIRILFRCWQDRKVYSEEVYQQALVRRHRPAVNSSPVQLQWKTCAGFSKIAAIIP
jgi:hypothetical protein